MRRVMVLVGGLLFWSAFAAAQRDPLVGRWEGTMKGPQGERLAVVTFQKSGDTYTGTVSGMRQGQTIAFKQVTVAGSKISAFVETPAGAGTATIKYAFDVQGDTLKGTGDADFGGQTFTFTFDLKRVSDTPDAPATAPTTATGAQPSAAAQQPASPQQPQQPAQPPQPTTQGQPQAPGRKGPPQPQVKQTLDYFAGQWTFKWMGAESPIDPGPRSGTITFTRVDDKFLELKTDAKPETGKYSETGLVGFDEEHKILVVRERRSNGVEVFGYGDWTSPIAIRYSFAPIKVKTQTFTLRRTISPVSPTSFMLVDEVSVDGGPFQRLGNATFTKSLH